MAYAQLKTDIAAVIRNNGNQEITGNVLQGALLEMINALGANYQYAGVADTSTTITTTEANVFYLLSEAGTYANMSSSIVHTSGIGIAIWNGSAWSYQNVPSSAVVATDATPTEGSTNPVQSGGVYDALLYESELVNLTDSSPYFVEAKTNITLSRGTTFVSNQYTSNYKIYLFKIPANKSLILKTKTTATSSVGNIFATIEDESDFVVGGSYSVLMTGNGTAQELRYTTTQETLLVFESRTENGNYNYYGTAEEKTETTLAEKITDISEEIYKIAIPTTATGKYIGTNGEVGSTLPEPLSATKYRYMKYPVQAGDVIIVNAQGGSAPRAWCFADSSNKILSNAPSSESIIHDTLIAPENSAYIVINDKSNSISYYLSKDSISGKLANIRATQTNDNGFIKSSLFDSEGNVTNIYSEIESTSIYIPNSDISQIAIYENCIKEIWVNSYYLSGLPYISFKSYDTGCYLEAKISKADLPVWKASASIANVNNNELVPLIVSTAGGDTSVGDVVGYVIFSDITTFKSNGSTSRQCFLTYNRAISLDYNRLIWANIMATNESVENIVISAMSPEIVIPETITAVVGDNLQIFFKSIINCPNCNNYGISAVCNIGRSMPRFFEVTPTTANVGEHNLTINVYDNNEKIVATKTITLEVVNKLSSNVSPSKNILTVAASTYESGKVVSEANRRFTSSSGDGTPSNPTGLNLTGINFIGRKSVVVSGSTIHQEANGGWSWQKYATDAYKSVRFSVNVTGIVLGAKYKVSGVSTTSTYYFTVIGINEEDILCEPYGGYSYTEQTLPSTGTLVKLNSSVQGADNVSYTNRVLESGNPFWNPNKQGGAGLDFTNYANTYCDGASIDFIYTHLGLNGFSTKEIVDSSINTYIKPFIRQYHTDYPNGKFILGTLQLGSPNGGYGYQGYANAQQNWFNLSSVYLYALKKYEELANSSEFSSYVSISNCTAEFDCEYGYPTGTIPVNNRVTETETIATNQIHPTTEGDKMISDSIYRILTKLLN